jgi:hypothetical protein
LRAATVVSDSVRIDRELRIRESVGLFQARSNRLFACQHAPFGEAVAAAVLCPSVYADFTLSYRRQVALARSLAARGVIVQRFHYRGSGNSDGDGAAVTYGALVEDAHAAIDLLHENTRALPTVLIGMGWGALVAASVSRDLDGTSLAVWEPVSDVRRYYREAVKARMIRHVLEPSGRPGSAEQLLDELKAEGSIDVVGYLVHLALYETARERTLAGELGENSPRILVIKPDGRDALGTDYERLEASLAPRARSVASITFGRPTPIWFHGPHVRLADDVASEVAGRIHSWLIAGSER